MSTLPVRGHVPTPRTYERLPLGPQGAAYSLVHVGDDVYELRRGTSADAWFAETEPGSGVFEISTAPAGATRLRLVTIGNRGAFL